MQFFFCDWSKKNVFCECLVFYIVLFHDLFFRIFMETVIILSHWSRVQRFAVFEFQSMEIFCQMQA
jgi:hypothetical protein